MSRPDAVRALAFGTPDGGRWGVALAGPSRGGAVAFGGADGSGGGPVALTVEADGRIVVAGDGVRLEAEPGDRAGVGADDARCRVTGTIAGDGGGEIDCPGGWLELPAAGSSRRAPGAARMVAGWFPDGASLGLLAARPDRDAHQGDDLLAAVVFDPEAAIAVHEPRLSTTYDDAGRPTRMNLELWVGEGEEEYPRRAAGEATGARATVALGGGELRVAALRCHGRTGAGAGVYALAGF